MNEIEGYSFVSTFGSYYPLSIKFNEEAVLSQLEAFSDRWVQYNKSKPQINRQGLSLTSLNGEVTGEIDLNSLA